MESKDVDLEKERQNTDSSHSPHLPSPANHSNGDSLTHHPPRLGTVIPNRIFVGGIDYKVNESDLRHVFSQRGAVKEVKIVIDHSGLSKGYGFVTFETQEDALKILHDADGICFKDKELIIAQAVRKRRFSGRTKFFPWSGHEHAMSLPMTYGNLQPTTSTGYPFTYHNGAAYFHYPNMNPPTHHWPHTPPVVLPQSHQPLYQQPAYPHYQSVPNTYKWNAVQSPMPSSPVVYPQQSEYLYQPPDGGSVQDAIPEFLEAPVQQVYSVYPQRTEGMTPTLPPHNPGQNQMFPHSQIHLKPRHRRYAPRYLPEATELRDTSMLNTSPTSI